MSALNYIEKHPYMTAGGVFVVGVVLVLLFKKPKAQAASTTQLSGYDPGYNAAVVAANSSIYSAGLAIQSHAADTQAALQAHLDDNSLASNIAAASISAGNNKVNIQGNIDSAAIAAGVTTAGISSNTLLSLGGLQNAHDLGLAQIAGDTTLGMGQLAYAGSLDANRTSVALGTIGAETTLGTAEIAGRTAINLGQINSNTALGTAQIGYDTNVVSANQAIAGMQLTNAHDIGIAQIGRDVAFAANGVAMNASNNGVTLGLAKTAADVTTHLSDNVASDNANQRAYVNQNLAIGAQDTKDILALHIQQSQNEMNTRSLDLMTRLRVGQAA